MNTVLVASTPIIAHTLNASRFVRELTAAGHRVLWYCAARFADQVRRCGAEHVIASSEAMGTEDTTWSDRGGLRGLGQVRALYRDQVVGRVPAQLRELIEILSTERVDVVLSDTLLVSAGVAAERAVLPWATFGDGPLLHWDETTPPFGTGLPPMRGPAGRNRNRTVQRVIDGLLFGEAVTDLNRVRHGLGLGPVASIREASLSPHLHLQGCPPGFEYPRSALPASVHFVGPLGPGPGVAPRLPTRLRCEHRTAPLALLTQGTMRPDPTELLLPACRALVAEGFQVVVAGADPTSPWNRWPEEVTTMWRVDYADALEQADLFVTNGGYTGVTMALAAGVPVIQCGASEEKSDIGARVRWAGVGLAIAMQRPPVWLLRRAVRRVRGSAKIAAACRRLAEESRRLDAGPLGRELLTALSDGWSRAGG